MAKLRDIGESVDRGGAWSLVSQDDSGGDSGSGKDTGMADEPQEQWQGNASAGYTPRENFGGPELRPPGGGGESNATPSRPDTPQPMAGSTSPDRGGPPQGVIPFRPMAMNTASPTAFGKSGGMFGSLGGLQGGGLGVPMNPVGSSGDVSSLIQMLSKLLGGR